MKGHRHCLFSTTIAAASAADAAAATALLRNPNVLEAHIQAHAAAAAAAPAPAAAAAAAAVRSPMSIARLLILIAVLPKGAALMKAPFQSGGVGAGSVSGETETSTNRDRKELEDRLVASIGGGMRAHVGLSLASCYYSALLLLLGASAGSL